MLPATFHERPELTIAGSRITFTYPAPKQNAAERQSSELDGTLASITICFFLGLLLLALAEGTQDNQGRVTLFWAACGFLLLIPIGSGRVWYLHPYREQIIRKALDQIATELIVENRQLIRRYASGREEVWPRTAIENVEVETRAEWVSRGETDDTTQVCVLNLVLRTGARVHLYGRAAPGTLPEQDLHWMAGELQRALQVPYDAPPSPLEGATAEKTTDGIIIHLPSKDPLAVWRDNVRTLLVGGAGVCLIFFVIWLVFHCAAFFRAEVGTKAWQDSLFMLVCIFILACMFSGMALSEYFRKSSVVHAIAERTEVALEVRRVMLVRRYASGREESWPGLDVAAVRVDRVKKYDQVQLHLKIGKTIYLYGHVPAAEPDKLKREGLCWLALEIGHSLGLVDVPSPTDERKIDHAITDLAAVKLAEDRYRHGH